jgi:hypothetical protein
MNEPIRNPISLETLSLSPILNYNAATHSESELFNSGHYTFNSMWLFFTLIA